MVSGSPFIYFQRLGGFSLVALLVAQFIPNDVAVATLVIGLSVSRVVDSIEEHLYSSSTEFGQASLSRKGTVDARCFSAQTTGCVTTRRLESQERRDPSAHSV